VLIARRWSTRIPPQTRINQLQTGWKPRSSSHCGWPRAAELSETDAAAQANLMMSFVVGRWHQFAKSGFRRADGVLGGTGRALIKG